MPVTTQTTTINGVVIIATLDSSNGVTKIVAPNVPAPGDVNGGPFTVTYDPAGTLANVYDVYALLLSLHLI